MRRRVPDLGKIRRFVGYRPEVNLDELLDSIIRDMREEMGRAAPAGITGA